ncbi:MAG: anti-sigma regulatory factor [Candidatus Eremiobacteraeota bacterium]|nr:anti-sigma regulatory factor [Candidatus Eremiobacteraeota bacterium]
MEMIEIHIESDIVRARQAARSLAESLGFSILSKTRVATAVSELARNTFTYGGGGSMKLEKISDRTRVGVHCIFVDKGPGIEDIVKAMTPGYTTGKGLGFGLSGSKRLMDDFKIESEVGNGTRIEVIKWK